MNILDRFTSIDDLLVSLLERIGGVTEEDTHFFSYPNDGTRATITKGTTTLDFMSGTVMTPAGIVSNLGNSLRARGREYCRSLSLQADRDIIIQIGTKSKIPVFAGTWFKVAHLRFTDVKIISSEDTHVFVIACTNPDSIEMAGETYVKDPVDLWDNITTIGNAEAAVRHHAAPYVFQRSGTIIFWDDFEHAVKKYYEVAVGAATVGRTPQFSAFGGFSLKLTTDANLNDSAGVEYGLNFYRTGKVGMSAMVYSATQDIYYILTLIRYDGTTRTEGRIKIIPDTGAIEYFGTDAFYHSAGTIKVFSWSDAQTFIPIKWMMNFDDTKYDMFYMSGDTIDLSGIMANSGASAAAPHIRVKIMACTGIAASNVAYLSNVIITENEP